MTFARPVALRPGSTISFVTPSGPLTDDDRALVDAARVMLEARGFAVQQLGAHRARQRPQDYLAASDTTRAAAWRKALSTSDAVIFTRGGYGAARLLEQQGWDAYDPWVMGFSDATALLWARYAHGRMGGVHGPCAKNLSTHPQWSIERALELLEGHPVEPLRVTHLQGPTSVVRAPIIAGNLTVATSLLDTPYMPSVDGHIVVIEDVNEAPYRIDRMLTQWRLSGRLARIGALVCGTFDSTPDPASYEAVLDRTADLDVPVYACADIGHHGVCAALPIGGAGTISRGRLRVDANPIANPIA